MSWASSKSTDIAQLLGSVQCHVLANPYNQNFHNLDFFSGTVTYVALFLIRHRSQNSTTKLKEREHEIIGTER